jgi:two-component system, cell cycle response regulator
MRRIAPTGTAATLRTKNLALQTRLARLTAQVVRNNSILHRSQERELQLLRATSLTELLESLIHGLKASYQLDAVALVLRDPEHEIRHLLEADPVIKEDREEMQFVDAFAAISPALEGLERPWLGAYQHEAHAALFPAAKGLGSLALIPLKHSDSIDGVLVFGSTEKGRFSPKLASDFLAHLGLVSAVCLENAVNRARLLRSGFTDFLTGFYNRRYLQARLREELARAQRTHQTLSFLMIDIDHFKQINDRFGHLAGDAVLREVSRRIAAEMRTSDTGARFGGDEFAIVLQQGGVIDAERVARRVLDAVRTVPIVIGPAISEVVSLSIGVAAAGPSHETHDLAALSDRLIAAADAALYRAKSAGRSQVATAAELAV